MIGRADSPMSEPTCGLWSARIIWKGRFTLARARIARSLSGISVAASMPVRPAPTTTTVNSPGDSGRREATGDGC